MITLLMVIAWIVCVCFGYKSLQNLNQSLDTYAISNFSDEMQVIIQLQNFDKWIVSLFVIAIVFGFTMIKIIGDYSNSRSTESESSQFDSILSHDYMLILICIIFLVGALAFLVIWNGRKNTVSYQTQYTYKTSYNICYHVFVGCGLLLIPLLLVISYKTPFSSPKNQIKEENDFVEEILTKRKRN